MNLRHVTKFPLSFNLLYLIRKKTFMLGLYVWEVLAQGSSWAARKPQTANRKISRDRGLAVTFARVALGTRMVCSLQFTASSGKWFMARFFATKNCTASRSEAWTSFSYPFSVCLLDVWSWINELLLFFGRWRLMKTAWRPKRMNESILYSFLPY